MQRARWVHGLFGLHAILALGLAGAAAGCHTTLKGTALQPNPLALPAEEVSRDSKRIHIRVKDMDIPRTFKMYQSAWFSVVSRDRLRFHVTLIHKWEEYADVTGWTAYLEDDRGRRFEPEAKEKRKNRFTTKVWDYERQTARYNFFGDVIGTRNDGYRQRVPLDKIDLFRGTGDVVFYSPDLFDKGVKRLTLVLSKGGVTYRFTWNLYDPEDPHAPVEESAPTDTSDDGTLRPRGIESVGGFNNGI